VFVAREARHEHYIYSLTTAVPKEPLARYHLGRIFDVNSKMVYEQRMGGHD
jgi:hypothetical protein